MMKPRIFYNFPEGVFLTLVLLCGVCVSGTAQTFRSSDKSPPPRASTTTPSGAPRDFSNLAYGDSLSNSGAAGDGAYAVTIPLTTGAMTQLAQQSAVVVASPGADTNPAGEVISATRSSLTMNANPWTPVMGEFHYSRYPAAEWRDEILKMKSGGIDIVATYVFWIHHEEIEGRFDWSGDRDLRRFVQTCGELGMRVMVRLGPWCHGEVRHGGLPDWLVASGCRLRSDDPRYMDKARILYSEIAAQIDGLLWKDGGPVIGVQLENEYRGPAEHLLALKKMAIDAGMVVPLYTRTGWPALTTPMPPGEIVPLHGVYAEGFWDREITPMPGNYWTGFRFTTLRVDSNIANEALGRDNVADDPDVASYPYMTCEIGGGMMSSYHRRILIDPRDIESTTLVKLGSGSVQPGYYMYHGGVNPESATGVTLQENQSTRFTNWNDLPEKNYDFQAPLGLGGQVRPHYHLLRRQHLFMHDFGYLLSGMPTVLPANRPVGKDDKRTLRWAMRSNGRSGFIFVNNYQRQQSMPIHRGVQFALNLPPLESVSPLPGSADATRAAGLSGTTPDAARRAAVAQAVSKRMVPVAPVDIPADISFFWPFNFDLGNGAILAYATAQPLCFADTPDEKERVYFFSEIPGIPPELAFNDLTVRDVSNASGRQRKGDGLVRITSPKSGHSPAITLRSYDGRAISIVILSYADSLNLYKLTWGDEDRVFLSKHPVTIDTDETLRVHTPSPDSVDVLVYPRPDPNAPGAKNGTKFARWLLTFLTGIQAGEGVFAKITVPGAANPALAKVAAPRAGKIRDAGPPREIPLGKSPRPVPAAPAAADFAAAAAWKITLPSGVWNNPTEPILRIHYTGDIARVLLDGNPILDDFYNGHPLDLPLARLAGKLDTGAQLTLEILPLRKDAPILLPNSAFPRFGPRASVAELGKLEILQTFTHTLVPSINDGTSGSEEKDEP
ncbi:beta-galactosidase [Ereboglobus sp. PH5-10]|nr:beta-galactosidase [Ereboglobus sp. PH5-10]